MVRFIKTVIWLIVWAVGITLICYLGDIKTTLSTNLLTVFCGFMGILCGVICR